MPHWVLPPYGLTAAPDCHPTWSCCSWFCLSTLLVSFVMAWWHCTGLLEQKIWDVTWLVCLAFCWRGSGAQENPSHRDTLPDDSVNKARDKAVTPSWPSWPEVGQTCTGNTWAGTFLSGQSEQPALPLKKSVKVLSPVHAKDSFLRGLLVFSFMWPQPQSCPLWNYLKGSSTYPPSLKHETKTQTHQCPNPACCPAGVRKNLSPAWSGLGA